jgi:hypothetical protein
LLVVCRSLIFDGQRDIAVAVAAGQSTLPAPALAPEALAPVESIRQGRRYFNSGIGIVAQNLQTQLVRPFVIVIRSIAPVLPVATTLVPYYIRIWGVEDSNLRRLSQQIYRRIVVILSPYTALYCAI